MSHLTQTLHSRSKVKVTRPLSLVVLAGQHGHTVMVAYPYAYMTYIVCAGTKLCCLVSEEGGATNLPKILHNRDLAGNRTHIRANKYTGVLFLEALRNRT